MVLDYINTVLTSVGLYPILSISEINSLINSAVEWWNCLNPQLLFSIFVILSCSYAFFFICAILPFRLFKRLFKIDKKRGK